MRLCRLSVALALSLWLVACTYGVNVMDVPSSVGSTEAADDPTASLQQDDTSPLEPPASPVTPASPTTTPNNNPPRDCVVFVDGRAIGSALDGKSWATAFKTVQEGILFAFNRGVPCEVWVAGGTYSVYQSSAADSIVLKNNVSVYGGFVGQETARDQRILGMLPSILDGQNKVYHVLRTSVQCLLDGFSIQQGQGYCVSGSTASRCTALDSTGGGMLVEGGIVTIANSTFSRNTAARGGAIYQSGGSLVLKNVRFTDNSADQSGGAIHTVSGDAQLSNCTFFNNLATQTYGNTVYNQLGTYSFLNCTLADTKSTGGEIFYQESVRLLQIKNSILWPVYYRVYPLTMPTQPVDFTCSNFARDLLPSDGPTNFSADPVFANLANGDLHLRESSPCVDAADGTGAPDRDLDGKARFDDPQVPNFGVGAIPYVDIGAFEYTP